MMDAGHLIGKLRKVPRDRLDAAMRASIDATERALGCRVSVYEIPDGPVFIVDHAGDEPTRERLIRALNVYLLDSAAAQGRA